MLEHWYNRLPIGVEYFLTMMINTIRNAIFRDAKMSNAFNERFVIINRYEYDIETIHGVQRRQRRAFHGTNNIRIPRPPLRVVMT
jgi:hypothetical protein